MKHKTSSLIAVGALALFVIALTPSVQAGDPGRKLGRGLANTLFGISEIPETIYSVNRDYGGGAAITWGVVKGVGRFVGRELTGIYEIVTFPIPLPLHYDPIMQPEFPLSMDKGEI